MAYLAESDDREGTTKTTKILTDSALHIAVLEFAAPIRETFTVL
jgi:hypothetical protein